MVASGVMSSALAPESLVLRRITFRDHQPSTCFLAPTVRLNLGFILRETCFYTHHTFHLGFPTDVCIYAYGATTAALPWALVWPCVDLRLLKASVAKPPVPRATIRKTFRDAAAESHLGIQEIAGTLPERDSSPGGLFIAMIASGG
ncbi:hypothetical protein QYE76_015150 [Lolium multiflorum]|uniref:Uncharacterized protein n=1 Tax=Lolium multiflorum TaxID=4521 RepID=A0AAD8U5W7_LOLMU|nr:hypothetical protein QYE76_015150 [Lolium multiflorum]